MKIERKENMNIIYADAGYKILWNGSYANYIALPLTRDVDAVAAECVEYTIEEAEAAERAEEEATEEDYLAALEVLGVTE